MRFDLIIKSIKLYTVRKIIIIRGNSGCGKTTVSQLLQKQLGREILLIPQDVARHDMLHVKDVPGNLSIKFMKYLVDFGFQNCEYTILERILYADYYQDLFQHIINLYADQVYAYYFTAPFDVTYLRQKNRPTCNKFGVKEMREIWRDNDYLPNIKETTIDTLNMSAEKIVAKILADINFKQ